MDAEYLQARLEIWKRWMYASPGVSVTLLATSVARLIGGFSWVDLDLVDLPNLGYAGRPGLAYQQRLAQLAAIRPFEYRFWVFVHRLDFISGVCNHA